MWGGGASVFEKLAAAYSERAPVPPPSSATASERRLFARGAPECFPVPSLIAMAGRQGWTSHGL